MADPRGGVEPKSGWGLAAGLAVLALALLLVVIQAAPPAAKSKAVPLTEFSAGRALEVERGLLGDGAPHPTGSPAQARVRERILAQLRWLGYSPEVQEELVCASDGVCARVHNVLARLAGREPGKSVLLMAHYDSVPAGPGASDDLAAVAAILEIARILKAGPPLRHGVLLLLDDGEEAGLLGAHAFVERNRAMDEVGAVVNLEARGSKGPSLMFETTGPDAWTVARFASQASRPYTSSLFPTVYKFVPNTTDLMLFKGRDVPGLNFALIGNPTQYHNSQDTLANVSPASLQHHGDNALAAVRGMADGDLARLPGGRAVFFDLLHIAVVRWPAGLSPLLGLLALALTLAAAVVGRRRRLLTWGSTALGLMIPLAAMLLTLAVAFGLQALLAGAFPAPWVARPLAAIAAFWLVSLAVTSWTAILLTRRGGMAGIWSGVWIFWSLLGLLLGLLQPGLSYLFVVPALVAGLAGLVGAGRPLASILPLLAAAVIWFPALVLLYDGLGLTGLLATAVLLAFVYATLAPLLAVAGPRARRWLPLTAAAAAVVCAVLAMVSPPFSVEFPHSITLQLHEDADSGVTRWVLRGTRPFPPALLKAGGFARQPRPPFPWSSPKSQALVAPAPALQAAGPELTVLEDSAVGGERHLRLRLTSPRGAPVGVVYVPDSARLTSIKIDGQTIRLEAGGPVGWRPFTNLTLPAAGSELEVTLGATQPLEWYVLDRTYGLPPSFQALPAARPKNTSQFQDGDVTMVSRKVRI